MSHPSPNRLRGRRAVLLALTLGVTCAVSGCGASGNPDPLTKDPQPLPAAQGATQRIGQQNLGYLWPLTVQSGTLECRAGTQAVFVADGRSYALNREAEAAGAQDIEGLRADNGSGGHPSLGALRSHALQLCSRS